MIKREFRGRGINLALAAHSYLSMIARGYKTASYTVVLDDNWPSRRTAEKLGASTRTNALRIRLILNYLLKVALDRAVPLMLIHVSTLIQLLTSSSQRVHLYQSLLREY